MTHRERCYRCWRPGALCLCATIPIVHTRTRLVVLQHPRERRHAFNTARLVELSLSSAELVHGRKFDDGSVRCAALAPEGAAVLYPHRDAADLATMPAGQRPGTLVVLDGTWSQAKKLYYSNEWVRRLPHVRLYPDAPSRYRIRREPQADLIEASVRCCCLVGCRLVPGHPRSIEVSASAAKRLPAARG